ncbi:MAG: ribbon-helix-helix domain-containing protein [Lachnospiraceae bacterium]|nr:ribbon-helix-helix domain-containing protein [Butyrivibrio sp.]MCM1343596.1 ribbon-helix-helix domain-containing protein [Muribaculaceae bacterium]MCM1411235.1 ribbon-helix-helix domain-containing protein [Lachnospiraceae bacterium]
MKPLKTKVSITLDTDLVQSIRQLAEEDDRSFSQYVNLILKEYLKEKERRKRQE